MAEEEKRKAAPQQVLNAQSCMNLSLLDPPRWGWSAVGGVTDLLTPQERSQRRSTQVPYRRQKRRARRYSLTKDDSSSCSSRMNGSAPKGPLTTGLSGINPASSVPFLHVPPLNYLGSAQQQFTKLQQQFQQPPSAPAAAAAAAAIPKESINLNSASRNPLPKNGVKDDPKEKYWGMTLNSSTTTTTNRQQSIEASVDFVSKDGILDMYAYHRGREGMEPRDEETGELLCTGVTPADTNSNWDTPRLVVSVSVEFPLEDDDEKDTQQNKNSQKAMYKETIQWDLMDPSTPSPMIFATNIADDFGLGFGKMMDLAMSIQNQIDGFLRQNFGYAAPLASKDPHGNERRYAGPVRLSQRYDTVLRCEGGRPILNLTAQKGNRQRPQGAPCRQKSVSSTTSNTSSRRQRVYETIYLDQDEEEIEADYCIEAKKQGKEASRKDIAQKCMNDGVVGLLDKKKDTHCHICHKRANIAFTFACGIQTHSYCALHCRNRLNLEEVPGVPCVLDYCPICSLNCECSACTRKCGVVARALKQTCKEQNKNPSEVVLDNMLARCLSASASRAGFTKIVKTVRRKEQDAAKSASSAPEVTTNATPSIPRKTRHSEEKPSNATGPIQRVPKPPLVDFPREVCGSQELDPGTPDDYMRIYTAEGAFPVDSLPEAWIKQKAQNVKSASDSEGEEKNTEASPSRTEDVAEDGNVDFCHTCKAAGNLLCCDFCPRAFHHDCLGKLITLEDPWRCSVCEQEKLGLEDDFVVGKRSLDVILVSFQNKDVSSDEALKGMRVLSIVHEMCLKLIDYDFGFMFKKPVEGVLGYTDIVKHPMDLGTICAKLVNGGYKDILDQQASFDDIVIAVLKDVELVWHNCLIYNFVGSAIYRMADIHRRRAQSIRNKSFDHLLSDRVKSAVQDYVHLCEQQRSEAQSEQITLGAREKALRSNRPKGKHKLSVKKGGGAAGKIIAILDPVCGRIVKMYSTMKYAHQAAHLLIKIGHKCEWSPLDVKSVINQSSSDPSARLFGYRWLPLEDLRNGKVKFSKPSDSVIEVKHNNALYVYFTIDEALSFPDLPKGLCLGDIRKKLLGIPQGPDWIEFYGISWRRPFGFLKSREGSTEKVETHSTNILKEIVIAKEDSVTGRKLVGFGTISAAFNDWLQTALSSPTFSDSESRNMDYFKEFYLDRDRNIDGIAWRSTRPPPKQETKAHVPETAREKNNHGVDCNPKETAKNVTDVRRVNKPAEQEILSESNGIEILRDAQAEANSMGVASFNDLTKHELAGPKLGKRKRLIAEEADQNKQWNLPCGGTVSASPQQRALSERHHGDAIRLKL